MLAVVLSNTIISFTLLLQFVLVKLALNIARVFDL